MRFVFSCLVRIQRLAEARRKHRSRHRSTEQCSNRPARDLRWTELFLSIIPDRKLHLLALCRAQPDKCRKDLPEALQLCDELGRPWGGVPLGGLGGCSACMVMHGACIKVVCVAPGNPMSRVHDVLRRTSRGISCRACLGKMRCQQQTGKRARVDLSRGWHILRPIVIGCPPPSLLPPSHPATTQPSIQPIRPASPS